MSRHLRIAFGLALALQVLLMPQSALAFDAGVRPPLLGDPSPGAVSLPFEIPIAQSTAVPQPETFEIAIEGFELDPDQIEGTRIGSLDLVTDSGDFKDKAIYSNGPGSGGVRTWTLDWNLADPIVAKVEDGFALDRQGTRVADPDATLIRFVVPGNYHGFRLMGLSLRFNQEEFGLATEGIGARNPSRPGRYLIRSRIESTAPQRAVEVASARARIGSSGPRTKLVVRADRKRVGSGDRVRFKLRTVNGVTDRVAVWLRGHQLREVRVGPAGTTVTWRAKWYVKSRRLRFKFKPANGPTRKISLRLNRHR